MSGPLSIADLVPGGILESDQAHHVIDGGTCSRCMQMPADEDVPLLVWSASGQHMYRFCEPCLGRPPPVAQ